MVTLTIQKRTQPNRGDGAIATNISGLACGVGCDQDTIVVPVNTLVSLEATPSSDTLWGGWQAPGCGLASRTCSFVITADTTAWAQFWRHDYNVMFVTSQTFMGDFGGIDGADAKCQEAASATGLGGTFIAFLSTNSVPAKDRLKRPGTSEVSGGVVRLDGLTIARSVDDLTTNHKIAYPVLYDEHHTERLVTPWTGSDDHATGPFLTCMDWTATLVIGNIGHSGGGGPIWAYSVRACSMPEPLYCIEIDKSAPPPTPAIGIGKIVYVTKNGFYPVQGIAVADALCKTEKPSFVAGPVHALLPLPGRSAAEVLGLTLTYARQDGLVMGTGADLVAGELATSISLHGDGTPSVAATVWTGSASLGGLGTSSCSGWSSSSGTGLVGSPVVGPEWWVRQAVTADCTDANPIYCVEE
jgi:hypothetical protein